MGQEQTPGPAWLWPPGAGQGGSGFWLELYAGASASSQQVVHLPGAVDGDADFAAG